jgi:hypothetical protein
MADITIVRQVISDVLSHHKRFNKAGQQIGASKWFSLLDTMVKSYLARDGIQWDPEDYDFIDAKVRELEVGLDDFEDEIPTDQLLITKFAGPTGGTTMPSDGDDGEFFGPGYTPSGGMGSIDDGRVHTMAELQPRIQAMFPALMINPGALAVVLKTVGQATGANNIVRVIGGKAGRLLGGWELFDIFTPGDQPSPGDVPRALWDMFGAMEGGREGNFGRMGVEGVSWAYKEHGPVVREWVANGTPFVMFMDGWQAAQKKNGSWKFWKAKKPLVYVPGGPMSRKTARRLASLYQAERKRAKKDFNLVDAKTRKG